VPLTAVALVGSKATVTAVVSPDVSVSGTGGVETKMNCEGLILKPEMVTVPEPLLVNVTVFTGLTAFRV
jgi:hypothetical protein